MGYRLLFMVLAVIIIIGTIFIILSDKQISAVERLSSSKLKKEAQQLSNSYVLDAARELQRHLEDEVNVPIPSVDTMQGIYHITLDVVSPGELYKGETIPDYQYYITCRVEATDEGFAVGTNALYNFAPQYWTLPLDTGYQSSYTNAYTVPSVNIVLKTDAVKIFVPNAPDPISSNTDFSRRKNTFSYYPNHSAFNNGAYAGLSSWPMHHDIEIPIVDLPTHKGVIYIYIPKSFFPNVLAFVNIANDAGTGGVSPITIDYDVTIIAESTVYIMGALLATPQHKITILSYTPTSGTFPNINRNGSIYSDGENDVNYPNPGGIVDADLMVPNNLGTITIPFGSPPPPGYTHDLNRRFGRLQTNPGLVQSEYQTIEDIITNLSGGSVLQLKSWEELPVEILP